MIEEQIVALIAALDRNTEAHAHAPVGDASTAAIPPQPAAPVVNAAPAPVSPVAAPATPPVAAQPAAVSPSEAVSPAMPSELEAITLDQLKAETNRIYQTLATVDPTDSRVMAIVTRYGGDLNTLDPAQYQNILNEVRALL